MKTRYNRISSISQNLDRQTAKVTSDEKVYTDIISGSIKFEDRPNGKKLLTDIKKGNVSYLSVSSIDRLGRNVIDILNTIEFCNEHNVTVRIDNLGLESRIGEKANPVFKLISSVMGTVSEMERTNLLERQREGILQAQLKGTYKGRASGTTISDDDILAKYKGVVKELKIGTSLRRIAKLENVSKDTVIKVKKILNT